MKIKLIHKLHRLRKRNHSYHHSLVRKILACQRLSRQMVKLKRKWTSIILSKASLIRLHSRCSSLRNISRTKISSLQHQRRKNRSYHRLRVLKTLECPRLFRKMGRHEKRWMLTTLSKIQHQPKLGHCRLKAKIYRVERFKTSQRWLKPQWIMSRARLYRKRRNLLSLRFSVPKI